MLDISKPPTCYSLQKDIMYLRVRGPLQPLGPSAAMAIAHERYSTLRSTLTVRT